MPTRSSGTFPRRATKSTIGINSTTPTSKNKGRPSTAAIDATAHGSRRGLDRVSTASATMFAPPESASSRPSIAPRPMSSPTPAMVEPNPVTNEPSNLSNGTLAAAASVPDPNSSARNGCSRRRVMSRMIAPILSSTAASSRTSLVVCATFACSARSTSPAFIRRTASTPLPPIAPARCPHPVRRPSRRIAAVRECRTASPAAT
ncbi:Uncharacterised protein [Mycobacteroides abscessus subsp. abscessus]|nr:Uncharacterised protein [Mycobacteroides abscessus subsp. abscessus]